MGWQRAIIAASCVVACSGKLAPTPSPTTTSASSSSSGAVAPAPADPDRDEPQLPDSPVTFDDGTRGYMYPCPDGEPTGPYFVIAHCDGPPDVGCSEIGYVGPYPRGAQNAYVESDQPYCTKLGDTWAYGECPPEKKAGGGCRTPLGHTATCQPVSTNWYPFDYFQCTGSSERLAPP